MTDRFITFHVTGTPAPQGSKRAFVVGNRAVMAESSKKVKPWRQDVAAAATDAIATTGWTTPAGPVSVHITFVMPRPGYHYRTGRRANELRDNAPTYVDKKPDVDKLARSSLDALTTAAIVKDDAQVAELLTVKRYAAPGEPTGAHVVVTTLNPVAAPLDRCTAGAATEQGALL